MAQEDVMKLAAEIVDKYSGPLKAMQKSLRETSDVARGVNVQGRKNVDLHAKSYRELQERMSKVSTGITSVMRPAMAALGIASLSAGGAIAAVATAVKKLGDSFYVMQDASKRSGLVAQRVDGLTVAMENLGIAPEAARAGLSALGEQLDKTSRRVPEALQDWTKLGGAYEQLGSKLQGLSSSQSVDKILDYMDKTHATIDQKRKLFADVLHAPQLAPLATMTTDQIRAALGVGKEFAREHPYDPALAGQINSAMNELRVSLQGVERDMANAFGDPVAKMITVTARALAELDKIITHIGRGDIRIDLTPQRGSPLDKLGEYLSDPDRGKKLMRSIFGGDTGDDDAIPKGARPRMYSPGDDAKEKQTTYEGTLRALREWSETTDTGPGAHGDSAGGGAGALFRPGARSGARSGAHAGDPGGVDVLSRAGKGNKRAVIADVARQLSDAGFPKEAVAGIMGNIGPESGWDANMRHPDQPHFSGEAHYAHGLYQEGGDEWNNYTRWLKQNHPDKPWQDPHSQTEFLISRLKSAQYAKTRAALMNAKTPAEAALQFQGGAGWGYLRPSAPTGGARVRDANSIYRGLDDLLQNHEAKKGGSIWDQGAKPLDLLRLGKQSGLMGGGQGFQSNAALKIDVNAPPGSIRTRLAHSGFEDVQFNRGLQMGSASQVG